MERKVTKFVWYEQEVIDQCVNESLAGLDMKLGTPRVCRIKELVKVEEKRVPKFAFIG